MSDLNKIIAISLNDIHDRFDGIPFILEYILGKEKEDYWIDLGLPSGNLWAKYNLGATSETSSGLFFSWGDTNGYVNGDNGVFTEEGYNARHTTPITESLTGDTDAVFVTLGEGRMPTYDEFCELFRNATFTDEIINDIPCVRFTGINGNSIVIPKSGCYVGEGNNPGDAILWLPQYITDVDNKEAKMFDYFMMAPEDVLVYRYFGAPIRGIKEPCKYDFSNGHTRETVEPGDIVYYNGTPIGVVTITPSMVDDGIGRMMALPAMSLRTPHTGSYYMWIYNSDTAPERYIQFGLFTTDVPNLTKLTTDMAMLDMDGKGNTAKIVAMHTIDDLATCETISNGNDTNSAPAAACCYCFSTPGTEMGDWYLPSAGEWLLTSQNRTKINYGIDDYVGGIPYPCDKPLTAIPLGDNSYESGDSRNTWGGNFGQWYWSSNVAVNDYGFYFNMYDLTLGYRKNGLGNRSKSDGNGLGCIRAFCHF